MTKTNPTATVGCIKPDVNFRVLQVLCTKHQLYSFSRDTYVSLKRIGVHCSWVTFLISSISPSEYSISLNLDQRVSIRWLIRLCRSKCSWSVLYWRRPRKCINNQTNKIRVDFSRDRVTMFQNTGLTRTANISWACIEWWSTTSPKTANRQLFHWRSWTCSYWSRWQYIYGHWLHWRCTV